MSIGSKNILEVAPTLTTHRKITSGVLARLVFTLRWNEYRWAKGVKCPNFNELRYSVTPGEVIEALRLTGYPGSLDALSRDRYRYFLRKPDVWHQLRETSRVQKRLEHLIDYLNIADMR